METHHEFTSILIMTPCNTFLPSFLPIILLASFGVPFFEWRQLLHIADGMAVPSAPLCLSEIDLSIPMYISSRVYKYDAENDIFIHFMICVEIEVMNVNSVYAQQVSPRPPCPSATIDKCAGKLRVVSMLIQRMRERRDALYDE